MAEKSTDAGPGSGSQIVDRILASVAQQGSFTAPYRWIEEAFASREVVRGWASAHGLEVQFGPDGVNFHPGP